jgi:2-(1,2-epoxy-1,2-dihydrophenyl)acetyl-CoA isomerase
MAYQFILAEQVGNVAVVTLNRPDKLNALSFGLARELDEALSHYENEEAVKAVILTGAGERAFSAGADIHEMADMSGEDLAERQEFRSRATWHIATYRKPLIGAMNGLAYGGAALLASTLDLRIGCEKSEFRFLAASYGRVNSTADRRSAEGQGTALHGPGRRRRGGAGDRPFKPDRAGRAPRRGGDRDRRGDRQERCAHGPGHQASHSRRRRDGLARALRP